MSTQQSPFDANTEWVSVYSHQLPLDHSVATISTTNNKTRCRCGRILFFVGFPVLVVAVVLIVLYVGFDGSLPLLGNVLDNTNDPFGGINLDDVDRWRTNGPLDLLVLNALEDQWQDAFARALSEWDEPDVLQLTTERVDVEPDCALSTGHLKVCNGHYGQTDWYGINANLVSGGYIRASSARLNDDLLDPTGPERKQYTMCHEIGHGFGLPHSDENFYNPNLGNCMDYTTRPRSNQSPDASNFAFLQQLYTQHDNGGLRGRRIVTTEESIPAPVMQQYLDVMHAMENTDRDSLFGTTTTTTSQQDLEETATTTTTTWYASKNNKVVLPKDETFDLGDGYVLVVHKLLRDDPLK